MFLAVIVLGVTAFSLYNSDRSDYYFEGNVREFQLQQLSLVQTNRNMDCDAFNQISVTYDNGAYKTLANGRQGLTPYIDSAIPLDLTHAGNDIKLVHFELALQCDGNAMEGGTTVVSGSIPTRICGDPIYSGTKCIVGNETPIPSFGTLGIGNVALQEDVLKVVHSQTFTEAQLMQVYNTGSGTIHFKHESFPILTFNFIHPTAGQFQATYNSQTENSKIIAQYGLIENQVSQTSSTDSGATDTSTGGSTDIGGIISEPPANDNDSDGILNDIDQCPDEAETFNSFEDTDGCADILPAGKGLAINYWSPQILDTSRGEATITVGLGIQDLSLTELAPTLKVANLNGFIKEEFALNPECITGGLGWVECEMTILLDKDRYPEGSYKLILSSESRQGIEVSVPIEFVDQTVDVFEANTDTGLPNDPTIGNDPSEFETGEKIINFITGKQTSSGTSSGVKITRSTQTFDFGTDDVLIIMVLVGITASVGLLAKYRKKLK